MLTAHGSSKFLILVFVFLKYVIFCVYPCCDFLWYKFFSFFRTLCGYLSHHDVSVVVLFIGLAIVAEANLRCADFVRKKLSSQFWQFFYLFGPDYQTFLVFINLKDRAAFLGF